ncbi:hypothetical protein RJJ65_36825, partial [Rhizobium hidalgonense]
KETNFGYVAAGTNPVTSEVLGTSLGGTKTAGAITITGTGYSDNLASGATQEQTDAHNLKLRTAQNGIDIKENTAGGLAMFGSQKVLARLDIDSDAGTTAKGGAFLNIAAKVSGLDIAIGKIGVAASTGTTNTGATRGITGTPNAIISGLNLKTGLTTANIQLGATQQGAMI